MFVMQQGRKTRSFWSKGDIKGIGNIAVFLRVGKGEKKPQKEREKQKKNKKKVLSSVQTDLVPLL